jgi:signal transduction histidine kinase/Fe-S-cluster-containing hydrogenase component 2
MREPTYSAQLPPNLVTTVQERCRMCYTCVRECPAKAIRIAHGQAEVVAQRCIGCGNCVRVCSQKAKLVLDTTPEVRGLLAAPAPVAACLAPSFPAEFTDTDWRTLVGMVRALGFRYVNEVGFGADLVARRYRKLVEEGDRSRRYIATSCPALVAYVERYLSDLVPNLAPIVSPMVATARALHRLHGPDLRIVFIGPCIAKKGESLSPNTPGEVDAALTFLELRRMCEESGITPASVVPGDFDPPHAADGGLFAISRGLLQAASIGEDLVAGDVVAAEGRTSFVEAVREFQTGDLDARLLEVLCCNGCIAGAGMSSDVPLFRRRRLVSAYVRQRLANRAETDRALDAFDDLDLRRTYTADNQRLDAPQEDDLRQILARMGKRAPADELNCGACGYDTCREHAVAVFKGLAESEMCLPYTIDQLKRTIEQLGDTQEALMQSERLASMGQLAAGIAHEVNNPLGIVLMYAHLLLEEMGADNPLAADARRIAEQADRCKNIVSGLLHFARQNRVLRQPSDLRDIVEQCRRALVTPNGIELRVEHALADPVAEVDADQLVQVLTNLVSNAYAAMPDGGRLTIATSDTPDRVFLRVTDTGTGIPPEIRGKIFEPFFTTKHIGKGTGLGLAVTYGIVKMHRGDIRVTSNHDPTRGPTGTTFELELPRKDEEPGA